MDIRVPITLFLIILGKIKNKHMFLIGLSIMLPIIWSYSTLIYMVTRDRHENRQTSMEVRSTLR